MKTNGDDLPIGYSAYCPVRQEFEYNEDHCYVADSPESLREFMVGCLAPGERYRSVPVAMADILADYGVSAGAYCLEPDALQRFECAAREHGVQYAKEPFDDGLMNVDVRVKVFEGHPPAPAGVAALLDGPDGPLPFVPVTFSGHDRPFAIHLLRCLNPQTVDSEMLLCFTEIPPDKPSGFRRFRGMSFVVNVDPRTWHERDVPQRSDRIAGFVAEFLRDVSPEMKREFDRQQQDLARLERELAGGRAPLPSHCGGLLSYSDFLDRTGPVAYTFRLDSDGCRYLIEDFYCSNPDCDCNAVNLNFAVYRPDSDVVRFDEWFVAHVPFSATDRIRITKAHGKGQRAALRIATSWCAENQNSLQLFRDRYAKIKKVGRQAAALADIDECEEWNDPPAPEPIHRKQAKVGRNQPCPCGSGKKYKKCCGKA